MHIQETPKKKIPPSTLPKRSLYQPSLSYYTSTSAHEQQVEVVQQQAEGKFSQPFLDELMTIYTHTKKKIKIYQNKTIQHLTIWINQQKTQALTIPSPCFTSRLIEPSSNIILPVLPKVPTRDNIVMLHGLPAQKVELILQPKKETSFYILYVRKFGRCLTSI